MNEKNTGEMFIIVFGLYTLYNNMDMDVITEYNFDQQNCYFTYSSL